MELVKSEEALLDAFVGAVTAMDPDILLGFEVQQASLGYLVDRAALTNRLLLRQLSRTPDVRSGITRRPVVSWCCSLGQHPACSGCELLGCRWLQSCSQLAYFTPGTSAMSMARKSISIESR